MRCTGENAHDTAQASVGCGLKVERRISDCHNFRDAIDPRRLHRVEEHERGGPPLRDVVTANGGDEILRPIETAEDGGGDGAIEACCSGHEITGLAELADGVFGAGNGWDGVVDRDELRGEFVVDGGGELFAVDGGGERLTVHEMTDDFAFGSTAPVADFLGRGVDAVMSQRPPEEIGDISAIFDDGAADIENYQPDGRR